MDKSYENLFNFLDSWFPDIDFEGITEKGVVESYKKTVGEEELKEVISEAKEVR